MVKQLTRKWILILIAFFVLAGGIVLSGKLVAQRAQAAPNPEVTAYFICTPTQVGVFNNRVHVMCSTPVLIGGYNIYWWAYPTSDSAGASRYLSLFETARATSQTVTLFYDAADLSGDSFGCMITDCHRIWGATSP